MAITSTRISEIDRPGLAVRAFYKIGERRFGMVPTPERAGLPLRGRVRC